MTYQVILVNQEIQEDLWAQGDQKMGIQVVPEVQDYRVFQAHLNKDKRNSHLCQITDWILIILLKRFK